MSKFPSDSDLPAKIEETATRGTRLLDKASDWLYPLPSKDQDYSRPETLASKAICIGMTCIILVFGIFGLWAATAPLNSAAIAIGTVILDNNKKTIQHLEGGIVDAILVREGMRVSAGDVLIKLDETTAKARYELLRKQLVSAKASEARLEAERDSLGNITFPPELLKKEATDPTIKESLDSQRRLFSSRRNSIKGRISILNKKIDQYAQEIRGLGAQSVSATRQIALLKEEIQAVKTLVNSGNAPRSRLLSLQRQMEGLSGERGESGAMISRAEQSIGEAKLEMINVRNNFLNEVIEELKETQVSLSDLEERIRASEDTFNRINILSPLDGTITDLQVHTLGGVIRPGDPLMDIVPADDKLIVEALVQPQDIDVMERGLEASIRLSAYKARFVPPITGRVVHISADRFEDERNGTSYYKARIEVDSEELKNLENVELYPGMPADVLIVTGSRTMLSYLFSPIRDSFNKSFRED